MVFVGYAWSRTAKVAAFSGEKGKHFEKDVSYGYFMVATKTFELPFFRKSIGDDFS